ncbi:MAG: hypothetical protein FWD01_02110 [Defluviitaleaceae bacterium]|nr:hypothetical protein [Defluviitaleaceae bacterium]
MEKAPNLKQWGILYEMSRAIRKLAPWNHMGKMDIISIMLPDYKEPVYCSVNGLAKNEAISISFHLGYDAFETFRFFNATVNDEMHFLMALEQDCLICFFGEEKELERKDIEIIESIELLYKIEKSENDTIYFRTLKPGHPLWYIDFEQADLLIDAMKNFIAAFTELSDRKIKADFDKGEIIARYYLSQKSEWINAVSQLPPLHQKKGHLAIDNELLNAFKNIKKLEDTHLELETAYLPVPIQGDRDLKPILPRFVLMANRANMMLLAHHFIEKEDSVEECMIDMLFQYVQKMGIPSHIYVRDHRTAYYVGDFCEKLGIALVMSKGMPAANMLIDKMIYSIVTTETL